jgi:hypothetical protein
MTRKIERFGTLFEQWLGAIMFPGILYIASRLALVWTSEQHWIIGAIASILLAGVVGLLLVGLNESFFRDSSTRVVVSLFLSMVLLAANVCSAWSYMLQSHGVASYTSAKQLHPGVFADFYLWHLIDMIPGLNVWETLGIQPPVSANNIAARVPLLVFRLCFVLPILGLIKKWYDTFKTKNTTPAETLSSKAPL